MSAAQPSLFGVEDCGPRPWVPNPQHVRNRLQDMLDTMRVAESWPWKPSRVRHYRNSTWPYLYERLHDTEEAAGWRSEIEAEAARLDAAASHSA